MAATTTMTRAMLAATVVPSRRGSRGLRTPAIRLRQCRAIAQAGMAVSPIQDAVESGTAEKSSCSGASVMR